MTARSRKTVVPAKNSRKSQATRARIMQTATDFISERGSTDFQMNEISDRCELSKGALYYYFIDKADLMDAIYEQVIGNLVGEVEQAVSSSTTPLEAIYEIVRTLVSCIRSDRPLVFAMVEELFLPPSDAEGLEGNGFSRVLNLLCTHIEDAREQGLLVADLDCTLAANAIAGACIYNALSLREGAAEGATIEQVVRAYLLLVVNGAATQKGLDLIEAFSKNEA